MVLSVTFLATQKAKRLPSQFAGLVQRSKGNGSDAGKAQFSSTQINRAEPLRNNILKKPQIANAFDAVFIACDSWIESVASIGIRMVGIACDRGISLSHAHPIATGLKRDSTHRTQASIWTLRANAGCPAPCASPARSGIFRD
ncbi:hypothetical protein [Ralstonia edaphi]|uniref:hypothetical protein n=1 Tax=Ralstonia edaphi TaxID=3058599 RepID=UPI00292EEFC6|nr:hypothetical protein [Ralstonia sp. LMG 6871]